MGIWLVPIQKPVSHVGMARLDSHVQLLPTNADQARRGNRSVTASELPLGALHWVPGSGPQPGSGRRRHVGNQPTDVFFPFASVSLSICAGYL